MNDMTKRKYFCSAVVLFSSALLFLAGRAYGLGYWAGLGASLVSFYLMSCSLPAPGRIPSRQTMLLLLSFRVLVAFIILSAGFVAAAHPLGMAAGITCGLFIHVYMTVGKALAPAITTKEVKRYHGGFKTR